MSIKFEISVQDNFLKVRSSGVSDDMDEGLEYTEAIIKAAIESDCRRLLCDERKMKMELGTVESFNHAEYCARFVTLIDKAAFIPHPEDKEIAEFWATALTNRGGIAKIFHDPDKARKWLEEDDGLKG